MRVWYNIRLADGFWGVGVLGCWAGFPCWVVGFWLPGWVSGVMLCFLLDCVICFDR